uniref:condensin complex subunit 3 isoform X2 n=1 Tax=Fragaria vesca subsp. vesca TaxID=101020 RepID=UPI0005CB2D72|nr:PREDICTED: condensin complex subunit 3 isoform X2 [Fragaria vesca subsp. vesca]
MEEEKPVMLKIAQILDEARASNAIHHRKCKELYALRSKTASSSVFFNSLCKILLPLFAFQRRAASAERVVRFVSAFAAGRDPDQGHAAFLDEFLRFLLTASTASNRTPRFRACQIISEIIMQLPDDAEVSSELWDEVIDYMMLRARDKIPAIRTVAVRALSRFASDCENSDIVDLFLEMLPIEQIVEVRKTIVLSLPPSNATAQAIIDCTLDVSESVRKAAYCVLASKFPLQSLSIKHRTLILQRGLDDRSPAVSKECLKLMKDEWLNKCCNGDPLVLLKYLDVETYEMVGESVAGALLKGGEIRVPEGDSIRQYISSNSERAQVSDWCTPNIQLMEAEVALYWRMICRHLQMAAQEKGSDAASTMGTEAAVYAAEATDNNDLLERILPATISDYIDLVKSHICAGSNYRFACRQLLLLGAMLDFSDTSNRKVASTFVLELLHKPFDHEADEYGNMVVIGDGINLGGDRDWADAVYGLASKVHAASGEFEDVVLRVVEELAVPCRERTADFMQWMHCLAVFGLCLEKARSYHWIKGRAIEPTELLQSLLLPAAKHSHLDVQRIAVRCLGLFGLLEKRPSEELVKQLKLSFVKGPAPISILACKALFDLGMWHQPQEVDWTMGQNISSQLQDYEMYSCPLDISEMDGNSNPRLLDLLYAGLIKDDWDNSVASEDNESVQGALGEGFAKILLLSENYQSLPACLNPLLLSKLITLYFSNESKELQRLKQCLSVFFEHYPSLSANHKKCISKAFIRVMRSMWPGINGNAGGSASVVSNMRKRAVQVSRFMLQMMQAPLYAKESEEQRNTRDQPEVIDGTMEPPLESGEEGLAIRIATEVAAFPTKKTPAEKSYVSALCRILVLLQFRSSEQEAIQLMRRLLNPVAESVSAEKDLVKELKRMADRLKALDKHPDQEMSQDQANLIFGRLALKFNLESHISAEMPQTPAPCSSRPTSSRRQIRQEEESSDEDSSPTSVVPNSVGAMSSRSQRVSKTAALSKITTAIRAPTIAEDDEEEESSGVTSDDDSDGSD